VEDDMSSNGPKIVVVTGTKREMGKSYGEALEADLKAVYGILIDYFVGQQEIPMEDVIAKADLFYSKYSYSYQVRTYANHSNFL
jgi:hypothetical protein